MSFNIRDYSKYFFLIYVVLLLGLVILMIKPVFTSLLLAILLTLIFVPVYRKISSKTKYKNLAATITISLMILVIILFVILPSLFFLKTLSQDVIWKTYVTARLKLNEPIVNSCAESSLLCFASQKISFFYQNEASAKKTIDAALDKMLNKGSNFLSDFILSTPKIILNLFIIIFISFYLIRDYDNIGIKIQNLIPLSNYYSKKLINKINSTIYGLVYGGILVAIAQGIAGSIGYFMFGVENYILFGALTAFVAFIPYIGTFLIWGLLSLQMMIIGYASGNSTIFLHGVLLFLYGVFVISLVDNILKPRIIGEKSNTHPIFILIGIIGGGYLFGIQGLIIGPILMAVFESVISFYGEIYERNAQIE